MSIGVLLFETAGDRLKGDPGYPGTFDFPVEYGVVEGSYRELIEGSDEIMEKLCKAARDLEEKGVSAIAGDCGLMALYQRQIADSVKIPVISSSLLLLPIIKTFLPSKRSVGILTGHSEILREHHLKAAGAAETEGIVIYGMQNEPHFYKVVIEGREKQDYEKMKRDVISGVSHLKESCESLGAVLLECSNLAVYAGEITKKFGIPVFDINTGIYMIEETLNKQSYR